jgi:thiamine pyrophosphokinase
MECLLVLGGNSQDIYDIAQNVDLIICADSGAEHVFAQGLVPDVLIGDMDSISQETVEKCKINNVTINKYPKEKDMTDGQLGIIYAKENHIDLVNIVCAEGSFDHYMGNIYLLIYARSISLNAKLITSDTIIHAVDDSISIIGNINDRVSILPANSDIIIEKTSGLYYEVKTPICVKFGDTIGLGNHMTHKSANIKIGKGIAFVSQQRNVKNT